MHQPVEEKCHKQRWARINAGSCVSGRKGECGVRFDDEEMFGTASLGRMPSIAEGSSLNMPTVISHFLGPVCLTCNHAGSISLDLAESYAVLKFQCKEIVRGHDSQTTCCKVL